MSIAKHIPNSHSVSQKSFAIKRGTDGFCHSFYFRHYRFILASCLLSMPMGFLSLSPFLHLFFPCRVVGVLLEFLALQSCHTMTPAVISKVKLSEKQRPTSHCTAYHDGVRQHRLGRKKRCVLCVHKQLIAKSSQTQAHITGERIETSGKKTKKKMLTKKKKKKKTGRQKLNGSKKKFASNQNDMK